MDLQCDLCPKGCVIGPGQRGECRIRFNMDGRLVAATYGHPCAVHVDPVEKKPLFHFLPGTSIFSLATVGCNLHCKNCQNWEISQANPEDLEAKALSPVEAAQLAVENGCLSIAYTYTDPIAYYEYAYDCSLAARKAGLKNVLVTAGYINPEPLARIGRVTDAANIDLKSIRDDFYRTICGATLKPVQDALVQSKELGIWVEVTNLVIPTLNDSDADLRDLCRWHARNLGVDTPLHFSRFFPQYQMQHLPPTPTETLERARNIARGEGMQYVYIGNVLSPSGENTHCPACGMLLIERKGFSILRNEVRNGRCPGCNAEIHGIWT